MFMKKRGNHEGSIYQRKDGKWCAQITTGRKENGTPKREYIYGKTRSEVSNKLNKALFNISQGTFVESNRITLESWLDTWLFEYKKSNIRPTTFENYEYLTRVHIKPNIGYLLLKDLRTEHIQKFYNNLLSNGKVDGSGGLSAKTINRIHVVIHSALRQAVKNNLIVTNISETTTLPKQVKKEIHFLAVWEQRKFYNLVQAERLKAAFILELGTGIREGELLALTWKNVNFEEGTIKITRTLKRVKVFDDNSPTKTKLIFLEPKSDSGKRTIPLPLNVLNEMKEHQIRQNDEKDKNKALYEDNDLVFCTEIGRVIEPRNFLRTFYRLLNKSGLDHFNFHALRHTYATRLLEANEHPKVVQEILGHSDITLTLNTYSHVLPVIKKAAAAKINHLFVDENPSLTNDSNTKDGHEN